MNVILQPGDTLFIEFGAVTGSVVVEYDVKHNIVVGTDFEGREPAEDSAKYDDPTHPRSPITYSIVDRQTP